MLHKIAFNDLQYIFIVKNLYKSLLRLPFKKYINPKCVNFPLDLSGY